MSLGRTAHRRIAEMADPLNAIENHNLYESRNELFGDRSKLEDLTSNVGMGGNKVRIAELGAVKTSIVNVEKMEEQQESQESEDEPSKLGFCDFRHCQMRANERCDYDLNDTIDASSKSPQFVLTCRWRGIRGCEKQFCAYHSGAILHWPTGIQATSPLTVHAC
jgi:hypothetical protein